MEFRNFMRNTQVNAMPVMGARGNGLVRQLLQIWQRRTTTASRLTLVERIAIGPRQSLLLVEADGVRLLIATSAEGAPSFFPLKDKDASNATEGSISW